MESSIHDSSDNIVNSNFFDEFIKQENQELTKSCPYCDIILPISEFQDHLLCHEIEIEENYNNNNNFSDYNLNNLTNNTNNETETENSNESGNDNESENETEQKNNQINNFGKAITNFFGRIKERVKEGISEIIKKKRSEENESEDNEENSQNSFDEDNINDNLNIILNNPNNNNNNQNDPEEIIKVIPTSTVGDKINKDNYRCVICLSDFVKGEQVSTLPCLHIFHSGCIENWMKNELWCPICKHEISINAFNPDFLEDM